MKVIVPEIQINAIEELPVFQHTSFDFETADERIIGFLNEFSRKIIREPSFKQAPAFIALGFWLRKSNLRSMVSDSIQLIAQGPFTAQPLGTIFHLCPSNVDTMFFYSLTLALLGGNKNIIRVSSRMDDPLVFRLFELLNELLSTETHQIFRNYINIVTYERNDAQNEAFSERADARVIWGGDATINQFKQYKTKKRVKDLYFADRVSYTLINTTAEQTDTAMAQLVKDLFNDVYTFDQMGCSSPHCLFFVGTEENNTTYRNYIYKNLSAMAQEMYERDLSSMASFKFNKATDDLIDDAVSSLVRDNNYLVLSKVETHDIPHSCGMGYLYYTSLNTLDAIVPYLNEKTQTLGHWGFSEKDLTALNAVCPPHSVDRIVPVGKALEFDHIWDGYDIFGELIKYRSVRSK